ncbi:MAG: pro-sigmaK processing inhibitor BofA family protein [Acidobacteriota bacterium]
MASFLWIVLAFIIVVFIASVYPGRPVDLLKKLCVKTIIGLLLLLATNYIGAFLHVALPVNAVSAFITGLLGVPGLVLLAYFKYSGIC